MAVDAELLRRLRSVAEAAGIEVDEDRLRTVAPQVLSLLARSRVARPLDLGETEPAFGLRIRKE